MAEARCRHTGDGKEFADLLEPICQRKGKIWVKYDEAATVTKTKTLPNLIKESHDLLEVLQEGDPKFNYVRSVVREGIELIEKKFRSEWNVKDDHREDYCETMTRRLMNLMRAVSQAERKPDLPAWVRSLPWRANANLEKDGEKNTDDKEQNPFLAEAENDEDQKQKKGKKEESNNQAKGDTKEKRYIYGFSEETKQPWRKVADNKKGVKEPGTTQEFTGEERNRDPITAVWPDGATVKLADCTVGRYKELQKKDLTSSKSNEWWSGEHKVTHHKVSVESCKDRTLLMIVTEQSRQICQTHVMSFAKDGEEPEGGEAQKRASEFMTTLAKDFIDDKIKTAEEMKRVRTERMTSMGLQIRAPKTRKVMGPTQAKTLARTTQKRPAKAMSPDRQGGEITEITAEPMTPTKPISKPMKKRAALKGPDFEATLEAQMRSAPTFASLIEELKEGVKNT